MAETTKVVAKKRERAGKGGARSSRRDGLIPGVIYGDKQPPMMIAVEPTSIAGDHPRVLRGRPGRPRDRPLHPPLGAQGAGRGARGQPRQESDRGLRRRTDRGARGGGGGGGRGGGGGVGTGSGRGRGAGTGRA